MTPILGNKMTPEQREAIIDEHRKSAWDLCQSLAKDLAGHLESEADKLTDSELLDLTRGGSQTMRCARALIIATISERVENQWSCESIKLDVKRARRWLSRR